MKDDPYPQRKHVRLDSRLYAEPGHICSIAISTLNRKSVFHNGAFARQCVELLKSRAEVSGVQVYAYCFMSDHLHLLISPSDRKSIIDFIREFKSLTARLAWEHNIQGKIWQDGYYDHFLRRDEEVESAVEYIVNNPVRAGLVPEWKSYEYSGSLVYDL